MKLLTNAAQVLACVARDQGTRLRDVAACVGITERAAHRIVCELEADGYITRHREGARNTYELHPDLPMKDDSDCPVPVSELLRLLIADPDRGTEPERAHQEPERARQLNARPATSV